MNKYFLSAILATTILSSGSVMAQPAAPLPEKPVQIEEKAPFKKFDKSHHEQMAKKMAEDLKLTDEQIKQADKIRKEGREKLQPLMDKMHELRKQIDEERKANMDEFEKILTPEQKKIFDEQKKNMPGGFIPHRGKFEPHKMMRGMHNPTPAENVPTVQ